MIQRAVGYIIITHSPILPRWRRLQNEVGSGDPSELGSAKSSWANWSFDRTYPATWDWLVLRLMLPVCSNYSHRILFNKEQSQSIRIIRYIPPKFYTSIDGAALIERISCFEAVKDALFVRPQNDLHKEKDITKRILFLKDIRKKKPWDQSSLDPIRRDPVWIRRSSDPEALLSLQDKH